MSRAVGVGASNVLVLAVLAVEGALLYGHQSKRESRSELLQSGLNHRVYGRWLLRIFILVAIFISTIFIVFFFAIVVVIHLYALSLFG